MSNDDLLAGLAPAAPKKPGRPKKAAEAAPVVPASTKEVLPEVTGGATEEGVNLTPTDIETPTDVTFPGAEVRNEAGEVTHIVGEDGTPESVGLQSEQNEDGSSSVILPPVSPDFALHMAARVRQIGGKREYAYHRVLRKGDKL